MKVWILYRQIINWETADNSADWWVYTTEEKAKKGFEEELQAFYEEYGKLKPEQYTYYRLSDEMVRLEIDEKINFDMWFQEEPVL